MENQDSIFNVLPKYFQIVDLSKFQKTYTAVFGFVEDYTNGVESIPSINFKIGIKEGSWDLYYQERLIPKDKDLKKLPEKIDTLANASTVFNILKGIKLCPGNDDFPEVVKYKLEDFPSDDFHFRDKDGGPKAAIQNDKLGSFSEFNTIRVKDCLLVIRNKHIKRCVYCDDYRKSISVIHNRRKKISADGTMSKFTSFKYFSKDQLNKRCQEQTALIKSLNSTLAKKTKTIGELISRLENRNLFNEESNFTNNEGAINHPSSSTKSTSEPCFLVPPPANIIRPPHFILQPGYHIPAQLPPGYPVPSNVPPNHIIPHFVMPPGQIFVPPNSAMEPTNRNNSSANQQQINNETLIPSVAENSSKLTQNKGLESNSEIPKENTRRKTTVPKKRILDSIEEDVGEIYVKIEPDIDTSF